MHGDGKLRKCRECGQSIEHLDRTQRLAWAELQGPRNINPSNVDRIFDNNGMGFLVMEEKNHNEPMLVGQRRLLCALSRLPMFDVWTVRGTQRDLTIHQVKGANSNFIAKGDWGTLQALTNEWFDSPPHCLCGAKENMPRCERCESWE